MFSFAAKKNELDSDTDLSTPYNHRNNRSSRRNRGPNADLLPVTIELPLLPSSTNNSSPTNSNHHAPVGRSSSNHSHRSLSNQLSNQSISSGQHHLTVGKKFCVSNKYTLSQYMYFSCQGSPSLVILIGIVVRLWAKYLTGIACRSVEAVFAGDPTSLACINKYKNIC